MLRSLPWKSDHSFLGAVTSDSLIIFSQFLSASSCFHSSFHMIIADQILQGGLYVDVSMCVLSCTELHDLTHSRHKFLLSPYSAVSDPFPKHMPPHTRSSSFHFLNFIFFLYHMICQILVPWPGMEPTLHPLEGEVLITGPPGKSLILIFLTIEQKTGFPGSSAGEESACNEGDLGLIPGLRRSPGEGKGYLLQYSCLENSLDSPWGRKESDTTERLSLSEHKTADLKKTLVCLRGEQGVVRG